MNEKQQWTGVAPSPAVLAQLDYEQMAVLALLAWCTAANQPVTSADVARLEDRDGKPLGLTEAREIVQHFGEAKIVSVFGMSNDRPMSVRVGGFQPRVPKRFADHRPALPAQHRPETRRPAGPRRSDATPPWVRAAQRKPFRVETGLEVTDRSPAYVLTEAAELRERQLRIENGTLTGTLTEQAMVRLEVLRGRIGLYERWLRDEPRHPSLAAVLMKKRAAVPEMEFQVERARIKQAELEASSSAD